MSEVALALAELAQTACNCQKCALAERRRNVVFGEGDPSSPLVLIGEGPGDNEDATGRPFVGRAGQLLDKALAEAGPGREAVYICNVVKCRAADWSTGKPVNRPPTESEIESCHDWLTQQLGLIRPKMVLCVGAPSAKTLIDKNFKITRDRGKYYSTPYARAAMATLHPSYILRQSGPTSDGGYSLLVDDIKRAWEAANEMKARGLRSPLDAVESQG